MTQIYRILILIHCMLWIPGFCSAKVLISEFMAVNDTGIKDEDGDREDWIELYNAGSVAVNLDDWYLTDSAGDLTQWKFPPVVIAPGSHILIWASNKNRDDIEDGLHTNFKLSSSGEYLALVRPDGVTIEYDFGAAYPAQVADISYGIDAGTTTSTVLLSGAPSKAFIPVDDSLADFWTQRLGFNDMGWSPGTTGVGYESSGSDYVGLINLNVGAMRGTNTTVYTRTAFTIPDLTGITAGVLRMKFDDGFAAFINGSLVTASNEPPVLAWNSQALFHNNDSNAVNFEDFYIPDLSDFLSPGTNILAVQGLNATLNSSDLLMLPELDVLTAGYFTNQPTAYFLVPTPDAVNVGGETNIGPHVSGVYHTPHQPLTSENIKVFAKIADVGNGVATVRLKYRVMFGSELTRTMYDDGAHSDGAAGDGLYGGLIPFAAYAPGEMVRYYIEATDSVGETSRLPLFYDPLNSPEYFGTMVQDTSVTSNIRVLNWFVADTNSADSVSGTRCSLYHDGEFYDNVFCRQRGGSSGRLPRSSHKFDFNTGYHFEYDSSERRVEEVNINTIYNDKTYIRRELSWDMFEAVGGYHCKAFPMHIRQNGVFYSADSFIEQIDEDYLERNNLDPNGALYKMFNEGTSAVSRVEKKTRQFEDNSDLQAYIDGVNLPDPQRETYLLDYVDVATVVNSIGVHNVIQDGDWGKKNHYLYRDSLGTETWTLIPWDKDLTWGYFWNKDIAEPLLHDETRNPEGSIYSVRTHKLADAVYDSPIVEEMYLCRMRTIIDKVINPASTPVAQRWVDQRINYWLGLADPDFNLDFQKWDNPYTFGDDAFITPAQANAQYTLTEFINPRRTYLYGLSSIPAAQPTLPPLNFGTVLVSPATNQDEEYIEIQNPNSYAVDISGWVLSNAVKHAFRHGTVIPSSSSLYVTPNHPAFRSRASSPKAGENLVVQGNYKGHLSAWGETVDLRTDTGALIATHTWAAAPSLAQQYLRVSEIMYHPRSDGGGLNASDEYEFIELKNIGPSPLDISGVSFGSGLSFTFPASSVLAPDAYVVLVSDLTAFNSRYDTNTMWVAGVYTGLLSNGGETIKFDDNRGETIQEFRFKDGWVPHADGEGFSLTFAGDVTNRFVWGEKSSWRASTYVDGSPGSSDVDLTPGSIVINEILAHSDTGLDWIELKNVTDSAIPIGGWFLSDSASEVQKYLIPSGAVIPAQGFVTFSQGVFGNGAEPGVWIPFAFSELGEEAVLSSADPDTTLRGYRVYQDFGASDQDVPFGRHITAEGNVEFVAMTTPTLGAQNSRPLVGPVLMSEVMYHPDVGQDEYIELYNASTAAAPLYLSTNSWRFTGAMNYTFPASTSMAAGEYALVVGMDPAVFRSTYGIPVAVPIYGPYVGGLANEGDTVKLSKPGGTEPNGFVPYILVEEVDYNDKAPWPTEADGLGYSLQRTDHHAFGNDAYSWRALGHPSSPGASALVDANGDGLPDVFQLEWFGSTNAPNGGATDDFDNDGRSNEEGFIDGSSVTNGSAPFVVSVDATTGVPKIMLPTVLAEGPGYFGLTRMYGLQAAPTPLGAWTNLPAASSFPATGDTVEHAYPSGSTYRAIRAKTWLE